MKNFDVFVGIDWSGSKQKYNKSIQVAQCLRGQTAPPQLIYSPNKDWSRSDVAHWIVSLAKADKRILIGIDCNFGYSQKVGMRQFGQNYTYLDLWQAVERHCTDADDFYASGYFDAYPDIFWTKGTQPSWFSSDSLRRDTEWACGDAGLGWPESPFKLIGAKQVGKGGLAGMRMALYLKAQLGEKLQIWPFEEGTKQTQIVMTEIYPRQFLHRAGHGHTKIRTIKDLNLAYKAFDTDADNVTETLSDHATDALIAAAGLRFICGNKEDIPQNISSPKSTNMHKLKREGWIFGV